MTLVNHHKMVLFATKPVGYGFCSKSVIYFTTTIPTGVTGKTVQRIRLKSKGSSKEPDVPTAPSVVSSWKPHRAIGINYQVFREFIVNVEPVYTVT